MTTLLIGCKNDKQLIIEELCSGSWFLVAFNDKDGNDILGECSYDKAVDFFEDSRISLLLFDECSSQYHDPKDDRFIIDVNSDSIFMNLKSSSTLLNGRYVMKMWPSKGLLWMYLRQGKKYMILGAYRDYILSDRRLKKIFKSLPSVTIDNLHKDYQKRYPNFPYIDYTW
jgi:hypothetical protein